MHERPHPTPTSSALRIRRLAARLLVPALAVAACSGPATETGTSISPIAAEVIARVEAVVGEQAPIDSGELVVPEGCRLVIELDEYNFETEVIVCDEEPTTTTVEVPGTATTGTEPVTTTPATTVPAEAPGLAEWIGGAEARSVARLLRSTVVLQTGCTGPDDLNTLAGLAGGAPVEVRDALTVVVADLRRSAAACNTDVEAWHAALRDALTHLEGLQAILMEAGDG